MLGCLAVERKLFFATHMTLRAMFRTFSWLCGWTCGGEEECGACRVCQLDDCVVRAGVINCVALSGQPHLARVYVPMLGD